MNKLGITKIEVLIVALIIGLLGLTAVVAVSTARSRTRDAVRLSDVRQMQAGLELYFNDFNMYPEALGVPVGTASTRCLGESGFAASCSPSVETVYLDVIGATPSQGLKRLSACGEESNAYCYLGVNGEYRIQFELENDNPLLGLQKGVNCATEVGIEAGGCPELETPLDELISAEEVSEEISEE